MECTWFTPNSASFAESHPEYQVSSSKHKSSFPISLPPGTNFCTTFYEEQECLQECQRHSKTGTEKNHQDLEEDRAFLRPAPHSPTLHQPSWTCTVPDRVWPLSAHTTVLKTATLHHLSFFCFIFPVIYSHLPYHRAYLFIVCSSPLESTIPSQQRFLTILLSLLKSQRLEQSPNTRGAK